MSPERTPRVEIPRERIEAFRRRWKAVDLALFGSVLRDDFRPDSDVDGMVRFAEDADRGLFDLMEMEDELKEVFGREVDLVERRAEDESRNPFRRRHMPS